MVVVKPFFMTRSLSQNKKPGQLARTGFLSRFSWICKAPASWSSNRRVELTLLRRQEGVNRSRDIGVRFWPETVDSSDPIMARRGRPVDKRQLGCCRKAHRNAAEETAGPLARGTLYPRRLLALAGHEGRRAIIVAIARRFD